ncbi:MAG: metallophosphoesterase [Paenibacillaceae bacterium]|nr:metallophosphoesterase [Paenibacillaceae bacterium]
MSFFILSDLHVNAGVDYPSEHLKKSLEQITGEFAGKTDCMVFTGDLTESGTDSEYKELRSVLSPFKLPPYYANMGNHDYYNVWIDKSGSWNKEAFPNGKTDEQSKQTFCNFFNLEKPYYAVEVKGYTIIMLSQEVYQQSRPDVGEGAWYSDEQLQLLSAKLAENKGGKPVFVMIHQPLPAAGQDGGSHRLIPAKKFREILKPYPNVFVFSGHGHQDFQNGTQHYMQESFHWFVNSSIGRVLNAKYEHVRKDAAQGLYVQVYEDRVELKGREFSTASWIKEADWNVKLQSAKV